MYPPSPLRMVPGYYSTFKPRTSMKNRGVLKRRSHRYMNNEYMVSSKVSSIHLLSIREFPLNEHQTSLLRQRYPNVISYVGTFLNRLLARSHQMWCYETNCVITVNNAIEFQLLLTFIALISACWRHSALLITAMPFKQQQLLDYISLYSLLLWAYTACLHQLIY